MAAVICGSLAFDTIMTFEGRFAEQILPGPVAHPERLLPGAGAAARFRRLRRQHRLQPEAAGRPAAADGHRGQRRRRLYRAAAGAGHQHGVRARGGGHVHGAGHDHDRPRQQPDHGLPSGRDDAGPRHKVAARSDIKLGIISPDGRDAMLQHAQQFQAAGIPFVFDPGQGLPMFDGKELAAFIDQATWVTVNDYEGKMLSERTGWSSAEISRRVQGGLVVTLGGEGCEVWMAGEKTVVPPVKAAGSSTHGLRRCLARRAAPRPGAGLVAGALRRAGQPGRRAQDRQPRAAELHAGRPAGYLNFGYKRASDPD